MPLTRTARSLAFTLSRTPVVPPQVSVEGTASAAAAHHRAGSVALLGGSFASARTLSA